MAKYSFRCPMCGKITYLELTNSEVNKLNKGALVQNVFPNKSVEFREVIISGTCYECQEKIFGSFDE